MPQFFPVGEWLPDLPPYQNPGALTARNVIAAQNSYRPFPQAVNTSTNTLGGRCQGAIVALDALKASYNYAGDVSRLYVLVAGNSYSNVSRLAGGAYATPAEDFWEFVQWGSTVIGVNGRTGDVPQQISLGAANFAALAGGPDRAGHIAVVREFVVMGNTSANAQQVRWSGINDATTWTASPITLADSQLILGNGGHIQKIIGGEYGTIYQERSIYRMTFAGAPLVFQFDEVSKGIGALVPQGVIAHRNFSFFLSEDGFYMFDGSNATPIGANKVDRTFFNTYDIDALPRITAGIDPVNQIVAWAFRSANSATPNQNADQIFLYNWNQNKWTVVEGLNIELLTRIKALGYTLDSLDNFSTNLDSIAVSLDSPNWNNGSLLLAGFNADNRLIAFNGSAMEATVDTTEMQLFPDRRATVHEVWPITHGASASDVGVTTLTRNLVTEDPATATLAIANATGFVQARSSARYHRFRITLTAGSGFSDIQGVMVDAAPEGVR